MSYNYQNNPEVVGRLLQTLRENRGFTQQDLADELGVTKSAICQWEKPFKGTGIKTEKLFEVARYFNISVRELLNGKLDEEKEDDYFARNYDLSNYPVFKEINEENYDVVVEYLETCQFVISRMMKLFTGFMAGTLNANQTNEFFMLQFNLVKDQVYLMDKKLDSFLDSVEHFVSYLKTNGYKDIDFELKKVYNFHLKLNPIEVLSYPDERASYLLLQILRDDEKNDFLTDLYHNKSDNEIANDIAIKRLLNSGALLLKYYHYRHHPERDCRLNENSKAFELFEGKMVEDVSKKKTLVEDGPFTSIYDPSLSHMWWKNQPNGCTDNIDFEETERIKDVVFLKEDNPQLFYQRLVERDLNKMKINKEE